MHIQMCIYIYIQIVDMIPLSRNSLCMFMLCGRSTIDRCVSMGIAILQPAPIAGKDAKMNHGFVFLYMYVYIHIICVHNIRSISYGIHGLVKT